MARPRKFDEAETLQKALQVFRKKGYSATSMTDLVEGMQINAPSLYATFGDKHNLFLTALRSYQHGQYDFMKELLSQQLPVKKLIGDLMQSLLNDSLEDPEQKGCFMVNTITELANQDKDVLKIVVENDNGVRGLLAELIRRGQLSGEITAEKSPDVQAAYLFTVILGLRVIALANPDRTLLEATVETVVSNL